MGSTFRIGALASALLASTAFVASAADLPQQVYKAAPMQMAYNWTGFYLGVMGGYAWGSATNVDMDGGFIGGTMGFNFQPAGSPLVFGVELDGAWADFGDSRTFAVGPATLTLKSEADMLVTLRGRVGYAWAQSLLYATGGVAWTNNELSATATAGPFVAGISDSKTHVGYAIGAGFEQAFNRNWSAKVEYLYMDFGSETYFGQFGGIRSGDIDVHSVKLGLNYRFGG